MEDIEDGAVSLFLLHIIDHSLYFSRTFPARPFHHTIALNSGSQIMRRQGHGLGI